MYQCRQPMQFIYSHEHANIRSNTNRGTKKKYGNRPNTFIFYANPFKMQKKKKNISNAFAEYFTVHIDIWALNVFKRECEYRIFEILPWYRFFVSISFNCRLNFLCLFSCLIFQILFLLFFKFFCSLLFQHKLMQRI